MTPPPFERTKHQRQIMTVKEVADYLKISPGTVYRLVKLHKLPGFRIGADWRFNIETIDAWRLGKKT